MKNSRFIVNVALAAILSCFSAFAQGQSSQDKSSQDQPQQNKPSQNKPSQESEGLDDLPLINSGTPLRCTTLQLLTQAGEPLKLQPVDLERQRISFPYRHLSVMQFGYHRIKKLKTNKQGEIRLPKLAKGIYALHVYQEQGGVYEQMEVESKPTSCIQIFKAK